MKLFVVYGHAAHHYKYDKFDDGMNITWIAETSMDDIRKWNSEEYKHWDGAAPVSLEKFNENSDDYTRIQIRRFVVTEFNRWIELYVLAENSYEAMEFVSERFRKCWSRWSSW